MAALQLVGLKELFTPACKHSLPAFSLIAPYPFSARKRSLRAFEPARRRRRKPPILTPITAHSAPSN